VGKGADPNVRSETGYSALFVAISEDNPELVQYLLDNGADPNTSDDNGDTALKFAKRIKNHDIISFIKKAGGK